MNEASFIVPHGRADARAYMCIPLEESVADRSLVMETLMDCKGGVELPDGVEVSEFLSWADIQPGTASTLSAEQLTYALKVGDQMGDKLNTFLAKQMAQVLINAFEHDRPERASLQSLFLSLNPNVKGLVFEHLNGQTDVLCAVATKWPAAMQQAFCDAWVDAGSAEIQVKTVSMAETILHFFARTAHVPQGLTELIFSNSVLPSTAAALCSVLSHHSASLASLHLPTVEPGPLIDVLPGIIGLSRLTCLTLGFQVRQEAQMIKDTIQALATAISQLPSLANFTFSMITIHAEKNRDAVPTTFKRLKLAKLDIPATSPPALSFDPIIQSLSRAPSLTYLSFSCMFNPAQELNLPCSGITGPFLMLKELDIALYSLYESACCTAMEPVSHCMFPTAPLPSLTRLEVLRREWSSHTSDRELVQGLVQQTALRLARLKFHHLDRDTPAATLMASGLRGLTALVSLSVTFSDYMEGSPTCMHDAFQGIAQLTALTALCVMSPDVEVSMDGDQWSSAQVQAGLMTPLSRLTALRHLWCGFQAAARRHPPSFGGAASLVAHVLPQLTGLTRLRIEATNHSMRAALPGAVLRGLPPLPELRHLHLATLEFQSDAQAVHWLDSLHLAHMTHLRLNFSAPLGPLASQHLATCLRDAPNMQNAECGA